ncbi:MULTISPECIES: hypothetical protein [Aquimarina]|uniref:Uncharacterized protein n=1 Tax=Aquimarina algicola TaxID=2589995 RepID=A0A504JK97_9FLAO|nr:MULTISPECIES: hypothetical protein [Aquimarina]TPN87169.1 hypothetical protein FHK87_06145 [Aquimarina algicola]
MSQLKIIDKQTLKLVDYLIALHKKTDTNPDLVTDYSFGVKFYPYNKYIVTHMRGKEVEGGKGKHAPHPLIIEIGKHFNIDFNFFYDQTIDVQDAFLSKERVAYNPNKEFIDGIFEEIDKRFELFTQENRLLKNKEEREICKNTEKELFNIKVHLNKSFSGATLVEKRADIIEMFDRMILLCREKIETSISKMSLEQRIAKLNNEVVQGAEDKVIKLESTIQKLTSDLAECSKTAIEAQKGQNEALKELLAIKSKN